MLFEVVIKPSLTVGKEEIMNSQLELLLEIQEIENKIASYEEDKKKMPVRKQLSEIIADVNSMQEMYAKTESVVIKIEKNCEEIKRSYEQQTKRFEDLRSKLEKITDEASVTEVENLLSEIANIRQFAEKKEAEFMKMKQQLEKASKMATDIGKTINQRKQTYDQIKPEYDKLASEIDTKINEQKALVKEKEVKVDESLLKRYRAAKSKLNRAPLFELKGNTCKGCNMSISNMMKKKVSSDVFVECENCGGLLYIAE